MANKSLTPEERATYSALLAILQTHTDAHGISHRPYGLDWINFERLMYRLLILRGVARAGDRIPADPWVLFLDNYAPRDVRRSPSEEGRVEVAFFPSSILLSTDNSTRPRSTRTDSNSHVHFDHTAVERDPSQRRSPQIPRYFQ
ncbi:uncharacterized protein BO97DRAFT_358272 [Aspergillus homomorphus CBS 101889]|uniref:Uncharacterized protein n=1 Tax=Aspergillus homomorphus (strain CBS 101889) TaxID=1450537 RepID=A0A395HGR4_ASPHC|nr:hypothetical protein BO97DRAFT_358272 [Aspergillus homomorphus CBS 101889]RAL06673.1 hypothetical protein BO97DRAFT_358272 [Aspergillus homomorphus CBS 101889]